MTASTPEATSDDNDPEGGDLAAGTVWYSLSPGNAGRLIVKLQTQGDLDGSMAVLSEVDVLWRLGDVYAGAGRRRPSDQAAG